MCSFFVYFFPPDIKQEPSRTPNYIRQSKLEQTSHLTAQPPKKKQDSSPHPPPPQEETETRGTTVSWDEAPKKCTIVKNRMFKRRQARNPHQTISRSNKEVISIENYVPTAVADSLEAMGTMPLLVLGKAPATVPKTFETIVLENTQSSVPVKLPQLIAS